MEFSSNPHLPHVMSGESIERQPSRTISRLSAGLGLTIPTHDQRIGSKESASNIAARKLSSKASAESLGLPGGLPRSLRSTISLNSNESLNSTSKNKRSWFPSLKWKSSKDLTPFEKTVREATSTSSLGDVVFKSGTSFFTSMNFSPQLEEKYKQACVKPKIQRAAGMLGGAVATFVLFVSIFQLTDISLWSAPSILVLSLRSLAVILGLVMVLWSQLQRCKIVKSESAFLALVVLQSLTIVPSAPWYASAMCGEDPAETWKDMESSSDSVLLLILITFTALVFLLCPLRSSLSWALSAVPTASYLIAVLVSGGPEDNITQLINAFALTLLVMLFYLGRRRTEAYERIVFLQGNGQQGLHKTLSEEREVVATLRTLMSMVCDVVVPVSPTCVILRSDKKLDAIFGCAMRGRSLYLMMDDDQRKRFAAVMEQNLHTEGKVMPPQLIPVSFNHGKGGSFEMEVLIADRGPQKDNNWRYLVGMRHPPITTPRLLSKIPSPELVLTPPGTHTPTQMSPRPAPAKIAASKKKKESVSDAAIREAFEKAQELEKALSAVQNNIVGGAPKPKADEEDSYKSTPKKGRKEVAEGTESSSGRSAPASVTGGSGPGTAENLRIPIKPCKDLYVWEQEERFQPVESETVVSSGSGETFKTGVHGAGPGMKDLDLEAFHGFPFKEEKAIADEYEYDEEEDAIGKGSQGRVYMCRRVQDGQVYALKQVDLPGRMVQVDFTQNLKCAEREIRILKQVCGISSSIVKLEEYWFSTDFTNAYLIMELLPSNLEIVIGNHAKAEHGIATKHIWRWLAQLVDGLDVIHNAGCIHRDLKPSNVLLTKDNIQCKIADFGVARLRSTVYAEHEPAHRQQPLGVESPPPPFSGVNSLLSSPTESIFQVTSAFSMDLPAGPAVVDEPQASQGPRRYTQLPGTISYSSPETICGEAYDNRTDIFSLGCILYELVTLTRAYEGDHVEVYLRLRRREEPPQLNPDTHGWMARLCASMMNVQQRDRPDAQALKQDNVLCLHVRQLHGQSEPPGDGTPRSSRSSRMSKGRQRMSGSPKRSSARGSVEVNEV